MTESRIIRVLHIYQNSKIGGVQQQLLSLAAGEFVSGTAALRRWPERGKRFIDRCSVGEGCSGEGYD